MPLGRVGSRFWPECIPSIFLLSKIMMWRETQRIQFLLERDGPDATKAWVERTLAMYRKAIESPNSHASVSDYRPSFEASIREFEAWLKNS